MPTPELARPVPTDADRPATEAEGLRIGVLGKVTAGRGGRPLDLGGRQQRAVLARLVLADGRIVTRDRLIDSLWGDAPPPGATGTLQAYLSHLRRRLEPGRADRPRGGSIVTEGAGYALRVGAEDVDAWRFQRLLRHAMTLTVPAQAVTALHGALALWRGPAFAEYADEPWAQHEAARLDGLHEAAREELLAARLDCGDVAALIPEIEALLDEDPLREKRWYMLAQALDRAGRQADARRALERARRVLSERLGVDPGPALRTLEAGLLARSPGTREAAPAERAEPTALPQAHRDRAATLPAAAVPAGLVDRERELGRLQECLGAAVRGRARLVSVEGPAGIGKTRLLAELREEAAQQGTLVLTARGSRREKGYAYGVVRQLLDRVIADRGAELLVGAATPAASVFDPAAAPDQRPEPAAVLKALHQLITRLAAERPLVLTVDDLQWADTNSVNLLTRLARHLDGTSLLLVAGVRTGDPHGEEQWLRELLDDKSLLRVRPAPLTQDGVAALIRARLGRTGDDVFVSTCHRSTSGNPFLLHQLLRALENGRIEPTAGQAAKVSELGSRAVARTVALWLAQRPAAVMAVAQAIAVLGDGAALPAVAALAGLTEDAAADALLPLVRADLVHDRRPLDFVHPLLAEAVYHDLPVGRRQLRHERAARLLHSAGAAHEQVAAHLLLTPHRADPWVVGVLRAAAQDAARRGAPEAAGAYLTRTLLEPPAAADRPYVLLELGRCQAMTDGPAAVRHLREAYATMRDPAHQASVALLLASTLVSAGAHGEPSAFARQARARLPAGMADARQALQAIERITGYIHGLDPRTYRAGPSPSITGDGLGARMLAAALAWEKMTSGVDRTGAVALARFALADRSLLDSGALWAVAGAVLHHADDDILDFWDDALAHADRFGSLYAGVRAHQWKGWTLWGFGELPAALESLTNANRQLDEWGGALDARFSCQAFTIGVLVDRGDVTGARSFLDRCAGPTNPHGNRIIAEATAGLLLAEGRHREALASLDGVEHLPAVATASWWPGRSLRAQALAGLGRRAQAVEIAEAELGVARTWGTSSAIGRALRVLGELQGADGAPALREAVDLCGTGRTPLEHARAIEALAAHLPPQEALAALRRARALAESCGAGAG